MAKKKNRKPYRRALFFILMLAILVNVSVGFAQDNSPTPYPEKQILILIGPQYGLPMVQAITPSIVHTLTENGFSLRMRSATMGEAVMGDDTMSEDGRMSVNEKTATNEYLTFTLADEQYAVDVARVREVISEFQLTVIPRMPEYIKGVINIRGSVVPVVDLRTKFGLEAVERTVDTSVIVMDLDSENGTAALLLCSISTAYSRTKTLQPLGTA